MYMFIYMCDVVLRVCVCFAGIDRLLSNGTFLAAFPLHDVSDARVRLQI